MHYWNQLKLVPLCEAKEPKTRCATNIPHVSCSDCLIRLAEREEHSARMFLERAKEYRERARK